MGEAAKIALNEDIVIFSADMLPFQAQGCPYCGSRSY